MATRSIRGRSIITKINLLKAKRSCSNPPKSRMKYFLALLLLDSYIFELRGIIYRRMTFHLTTPKLWRTE